MTPQGAIDIIHDAISTLHEAGWKVLGEMELIKPINPSDSVFHMRTNREEIGIGVERISVSLTLTRASDNKESK
jgi:hypothetical protein